MRRCHSMFTLLVTDLGTVSERLGINTGCDIVFRHRRQSWCVQSLGSNRFVSVSNYFLGALCMSRETLGIQVPFFARLLILALRFLNSILKLRFP